MASVVPSEYIFGVSLLIALFVLWGFANDVTNPMVSAFKLILQISHTESALVQAAFYSGYAAMAIPAAVTIKKFTFKTGILVGLLLYATGCMLFIPAAAQGAPAEVGDIETFLPFLLAYFVMTCGLSFLETSAYPWLASMGPEETATVRFNMAGAFNSLGSLCGMFTAGFLLAGLRPETEEERRQLLENDFPKFEEITLADLALIRTPYAIMGVIAAVIFVSFICSALPQTDSEDKTVNLGATLKRVWSIPHYRKAVCAQALEVGTRVCCWTFVIQYGEIELGLTKAEAQSYNIVAQGFIIVSRFACTYLLSIVNANIILGVMGLAGAALLGGCIMLPGFAGLWCLLLVSACFAPMFLTIFGIAIDGLGEDAKIGSAGLIIAIGGGAIFPQIQAYLIDTVGVRTSFLVPLCCLLCIALFGFDNFRAQKAIKEQTDEVQLMS